MYRFTVFLIHWHPPTSFTVVNPLVNDDTLFEELDYYKMIINRIWDMNKYIRRTNKFAEPDKKSINEEIKPIFFKLLGNASSEDILKDFYFLNIFLAMDNPKRLYNFLHSFKDTDIPKKYRDYTLIKFADTIPLSTAFLIRYCSGNYDNFDINLYKDKKYTVTKDFLELFHLMYLNYSLNIDEARKYKEYLKLPDTFYLLPEGIKEINLKDRDEDDQIINNIQNDLFNKDVIMPRTLKVLKGDLFNRKPKGNVYLNEGLETLDVINLAFTDDDEVTIPSSVKEIINFVPISTIDYDLKKIIFNNFNFENRNVLINIFDMFLKNNLRFFMFGFELVFHYDDLDEDITPSLNFLNTMSKYGDEVYKPEYRKSIIEDIVNDIEKEVQLKRGNERKLEK